MSVAHPKPEIGRPSAWVVRWLACLPAGALVLDFACGHGRHAEYAQSQGLRVLAVDIDAQAVATLVSPVDAQTADLEETPWAFAAQRFDAVIVARFWHRPRIDLLCARVAPGGLFIHETFMTGNAEFGKPSSDKFLLRPGELLNVAARAGLMTLAFEQGYESDPRPAMTQRICAVRPPFDAKNYDLSWDLG